MVHRVIARRALLDRHLPGRGRGLLQQGAGRGPHLPHDVIEIAHGAGAVGILAAIARVPMGLDHLDPLPVCLHFIRNHLRQAGADAGTHLGAMSNDLHGAVRGDADKQVELGTFGLIDNARQRQIARRNRAQHQTAGGETGQLQEAAAGNQAERVHAAPSPVAGFGLAAASTKVLLIAVRIRGLVPQRHRLPAMAH